MAFICDTDITFQVFTLLNEDIIVNGDVIYLEIVMVMVMDLTEQSIDNNLLRSYNLPKQT